jgi:hypothetical protein
MDKSQPDGTPPLPETGEVGGEGGSFADGTSRESRQSRGHLPRRKTAVSDIAGNATRLPDANPDDQPSPGEDVRRYPG